MESISRPQEVGMFLDMPKKREKNLMLQQCGDELLIYDLDSNRAHCLNASAAAIWNACDGNSSHQDISEKSGMEIGVTLAALNQFKEISILV